MSATTWEQFAEECDNSNWGVSSSTCQTYGRCVQEYSERNYANLPLAAIEMQCYSQYILPNQVTSPPEDPPEDTPPDPPPDIPDPPTVPLTPFEFPPTDYGNGCAPRKHPILRRHARKSLLDYLGICTLV